MNASKSLFKWPRVGHTTCTVCVKLQYPMSAKAACEPSYNAGKGAARVVRRWHCHGEHKSGKFGQVTNASRFDLQRCPFHLHGFACGWDPSSVFHMKLRSQSDSFFTLRHHLFSSFKFLISQKRKQGFGLAVLVVVLIAAVLVVVVVVVIGVVGTGNTARGARTPGISCASFSWYAPA